MQLAHEAGMALARIGATPIWWLPIKASFAAPYENILAPLAEAPGLASLLSPLQQLLALRDR